MQDRFVGDVGDFGKYGLLRALTGLWPVAEPQLSLGVSWYVPDDEIGWPNDGRHRSYLNKPKEYRDCDQELFDVLGGLLSNGPRTLGAVEASGVLGEGTVFCDEPIPADSGRRAGVTWRTKEALQSQNVAFLDPDKGLMLDCGRFASREHALLDEVEELMHEGLSVVVYHHLGRRGSHPDQMRYWAHMLRDRLNLGPLPEALWFRRGSARAFFVLPSRHHTQLIRKRLYRFSHSPWYRHKHFTPLPS